MRPVPLRTDTAILLQPLEIRERNAAQRAAEAPGIDTQDSSARLIVSVKFFVKKPGQMQRQRTIPERIHDGYACRQTGIQLKRKVESLYAV